MAQTTTKPVDNGFGKLKLKIKDYRLSPLVAYILQILNNIQRQKSRHAFWELLVLLKWCYVHTDDAPSKKIARPDDIQVLLSLIEKFQNDNSILEFKDHKSVSQSFRILAYQQFAHQDQFYISAISRQLFIYLRLKSKLDVGTEFKKLTGIDLASFFQYCFYLFAYINRDLFQKGVTYTGILEKDFYNSFTETFSAQELDSFLKLITIASPKEFQQLQKLGDERLQLYESNFFTTKPLIYFNGQYHLPHRSILNQTLKHYVYTYMKNALPDTFSEDFGKRMEMYVEFGLKEIRFNYKNESQLKKLYKLTKVTDYLVEEDILIECKATELHPRSGVLRLPSVLMKDLNTSIVKAYQQLLSTANSINSNKEWFGIIITYREMYLGFGQDAWNEFLQIPTETFLNDQKINIKVLPPQNLFFIDLEDWDYIVEVVKQKKATIKEILQKGREINTSSDPLDRMFVMEMVLQKFFEVKQFTLSYLKNIFEDHIYSN